MKLFFSKTIVLQRIVYIFAITNNEFQEFMINFKDTGKNWLKEDFNRILKSLQTIMNEGVKEYYFRPEGKMIDRVCALPLRHIEIVLYSYFG